jgi:DHA1 family multidrug resistance protein-like MFS transporter
MLRLSRWFPYRVRSNQWGLIGVLGATEFSRTALIVSLLPAYVTGPLGASLTLVGLAVSVHYLMDTAFRSPAGWLVDRFGPQATLILGVALEITALVLALHAHKAGWLILFMGMMGVGTAAHWPAVVTGTNRLTDPGHRGTVMGAVFAGWLVGSGLGPVIINFVVGTLGSDRLAFWILIAADVAAFLTTWTLTDPTLREVPPAPHHLPPGQGLRVLWPLKAVLPGMFVQTMVLGLLMPLLQPLTHRVLHLSQWEFAGLLLGSGALTVLLLVPMGRLSDRMGLKFPLVGGFWLAGASLLGLATIRSFWPLVVVGGLLGLAYALILPAWNAFLARLIPPDQEGFLWGIFMTVEGLGMTVGPVVGTHLFEASVKAPFVLAAGVLGVMGGFYLLYPTPRPRNV